jgi:hypothetical protein
MLDNLVDILNAGAIDKNDAILGEFLDARLYSNQSTRDHNMQII